MSSEIQTFEISPTGKLRLWISVFLIGIPGLFLLGWALGVLESQNASLRNGHRGGTIFLATLLGISAVTGLYFTTVRKIVDIDRVNNIVTLRTTSLGVRIGCCAWKLADFHEVAMRRRAYGDGPSDLYQIEVGIRHMSGRIVWLKAFHSSEDKPSTIAQDFADALRATMSLVG